MQEGSMLETKSYLFLYPPQGGLRIRIPENGSDEENQGRIVDNGKSDEHSRENEEGAGRQTVSSLFWKCLEKVRKIGKAMFRRRSCASHIDFSPGSIKPVEKLGLDSV
jgi:hypothetical protein